MAEVAAPLIAFLAFALSAFVAWRNHRLGLDPATQRYIASLEGLVKAREQEIADLRTRLTLSDQNYADLRVEYRRLQVRLDALEKGLS